MSKISRRECLGLGALLAAAPALASRAGPRSKNPCEPDLVLLNGRVLTMDETQPSAEAFAVKDGLFLAIGSTADIRNLATRNTKTLDAAGMTVTPGFID